jgi:hypothetical protein
MPKIAKRRASSNPDELDSNFSSYNRGNTSMYAYKYPSEPTRIFGIKLAIQSLGRRFFIITILIENIVKKFI